MTLTPSPRAARAITLLETVVLIAVASLLLAMLAAAAAESRRHASLTQSFSNLQQFAAGTTTYAADWQDRVWSFTDTAESPTQGVAIINSQLDGRPEVGPVSNIYWPYYSHLVLLDHLGARLFAPWIVSPEDDVLQAAQQDPDGWPFDTERPPGSSGLFPYRSSYELGAAFTAPDARQGTVSTTDQHGLPHNRWYTPDGPYGNRFLHEVAFPSQKAMVYERQQRFFGPRHMFFMYPEARVPILFADGAASTRRTAESNWGFRPNSPIFSAPTLVSYQPNELWEAPALNGQAAETILGHYRWTHGGLKGRDFGAPEIDTHDW